MRIFCLHCGWKSKDPSLEHIKQCPECRCSPVFVLNPKIEDLPPPKLKDLLPDAAWGTIPSENGHMDHVDFDEDFFDDLPGWMQ